MERTIENVKQLINEKRTIKEMANIFGITCSPMRKWIKSRGIKFIQNDRRTWNNEELKEAVKNSVTITSVLYYLGLSKRAGNYETIKKYISLLELDISHFTGKATGHRHLKLTNDEVLCENSLMKRGNIKNRIINDKLIPYECEICSNDGNWYGKILVLILDHKNGVNNDNRIENLRFLCPNCNGQQHTFCRKSTSSSDSRAGV